MEIKMLQIIKSKNNFLELSEILSHIEGRKFKWCIKEFEVVMKKDFPGSVLTIEDIIATSKDGYCLLWNELIELSKYIHQSINLCLLAYDKDRNIEIHIEMFDSSYWVIIYNRNNIKEDDFISIYFSKLPDNEIKNYVDSNVKQNF